MCSVKLYKIMLIHEIHVFELRIETNFKCMIVATVTLSNCEDPGGGGGAPLFGLYGDLPLDRVWFLASLS